ncbi:MAG: hypothetical protein VYB34_03350 [Planctomycetota bacterium]|nr:hypothetical protein [Planctomycetota bacterium]
MTSKTTTGRWLMLSALLGCLQLAGADLLKAQDKLPEPVLFLDEGEEYTYFRGTEEPPADWNTLEFDDFDWEVGNSGFGYGDVDDNTIIDDMQNSYLSIYIRKFINIDDLGAINFIQLGMRYDDGFIAYLNGVEIARSLSMGPAGIPANFDTPAADHESTPTPEWFNFSLDALDVLQEGENILAIEGHNTNLTSSDFTLIPYLRYYDNVCPYRMTCTERNSGGVRLVWYNVITPPPYESIDVYRNGEFLGNPSTPRSRIFTDQEAPPGEHVYEISVTTLDGTNCSEVNPLSCTIVLEGEKIPPATGFRRGDADDSGVVNLTDGIFILSWLFRGGGSPTCQDSSDADDNGAINLTDAIFLLVHLFRTGPAPPAPGMQNCGADGTSDDTLADCDYNSC